MGPWIWEILPQYWSCTRGSLFLSNGEEDRNMPLNTTVVKISCQEHRRDRMDSWSDLVWIIQGE